MGSFDLLWVPTSHNAQDRVLLGPAHQSHISAECYNLAACGLNLDPWLPLMTVVRNGTMPKPACKAHGHFIDTV